ncbi:MAG: hypothetical protein AVDCRST_MAG56-176 [uncultured Cytophagales bacterium]|uniref:Uncharacterized protein n=1 Tax=uncultured Cytophagales bacterium TaxID=158755 RepID=A0A6J4H6S1_9SPHI|nr:MAG: hypothetical protein AVDCRST_MAG56-176 [uncultured Cytophagales bacterium]
MNEQNRVILPQSFPFPPAIIFYFAGQCVTLAKRFIRTCVKTIPDHPLSFN